MLIEHLFPLLGQGGRIGIDPGRPLDSRWLPFDQGLGTVALCTPFRLFPLFGVVCFLCQSCPTF